MSESDRRKFFRVLFDAKFEVRTSEWTDKEASGLDISLNGCRFNTKQSISDGEIVNIVFKPGLEIEGSLKWCWPIEWYFQAALCFEDITQEKQSMLKAYIEDATGVDYQIQNSEGKTGATAVESVEILEEDLDEIDNDLSASIIDVEDQEDVPKKSTEEDEIEGLTPLEEEDLLNLDIEESIDTGPDITDVLDDQKDVSEKGTEEDELEGLPPLEEEDLLNLDIEESIDTESDISDVVEDNEDEIEGLPPLEEEDLLNLDIEESIDTESDFSDTEQDEEFIHELDEGDINILSFVGKKVVLYDLEKDQAELLNQYLSERARMEVEYVTKKENLWRMLKIDQMDLVIIETGAGVNSDALEVMQQTKDQFPEVKFICISGPISLERRLQFLNAGALDYLTRPVHLSTIAQSVLVHLRHTLVEDFAADINPQREMVANNKELREELKLMTEQRDEARADAKANAFERDEAAAENKELEQRAHKNTEEKESIYLDETFIADADSNSDSSQIDPVEDLNGAASLLDEDLKISEEVNLIEEDY